MQKIILFIFISLTAGLLLTNMYTSIVDAASWSSNIPDSIQAARDHFKTSNPGNFFRIFSPLNQFMAFLTLVLFWHSSKKARLYFALALILVVSADLFTFTYFYPRNAILFESPMSDLDAIRNASNQWVSMNWVRSLVVAAGLTFAFLGMHEIYKAEFSARLDM